MAKKRKLKNARNLAEWLGGLSESSVKLLATLPRSSKQRYRLTPIGRHWLATHPGV